MFPRTHNPVKRRLAASLLGLMSLGLLTACQTTPVDPAAGWIRVEPQISDLRKQTYEIIVTDLSNRGHIDFILGAGSRAAQWLTPGPTYHVEVNRVKPHKNGAPGLDRATICDQTVATRGHSNMVIVVATDGCHIEH